MSTQIPRCYHIPYAMVPYHTIAYHTTPHHTKADALPAGTIKKEVHHKALVLRWVCVHNFQLFHTHRVVSNMCQQCRQLCREPSSLYKGVGQYIFLRYGLYMGYAIAGSCASAIAAAQYSNFALHFNDIDVYILKSALPALAQVECREKKQYDYDSYIVACTIDRVIIEDEHVLVNVIILDDKMSRGSRSNSVNLHRLVNSFDINAVKIACQVGYDEILSEWILKQWRISDDYVDFMASRTLQIPDLNKVTSPIQSIVRLAFKSHTMRLPMVLPPPRLTRLYLTTFPLTESYVLKWKMLPPEIKNLEQFRNLRLHQSTLQTVINGRCREQPFWRLVAS
jgi:hypothetical protein